MGRFILQSALAVLWISICAGAAQSFDQGPVFALVEENDAPMRSDRHYTQGIKLSYLQADGNVPRWFGRIADALPELGIEPRVNKFGYALGQSIFTPDNTDAKTVVRGDRPYAGWLYVGLVLQRRGLTANRWLTIDHLELNAGAIGKASLADEAQGFVHELTGSREALGWDNQLEAEPGLALKYQRAWVLSPGQRETRFFDLLPRTGVSLGNIDTSLRIGGTFRLGVNLPDSFGPQTIDSLMTTEGGRSRSRETGRYGFYVYGSAEGRAVLFNTFLDGNLYHVSHDVDRKVWVAEFQCGAVVALDGVEAGFAAVLRTREFKGQEDNDPFGSLFVKIRF